jgi:hypothetical protein
MIIQRRERTKYPGVKSILFGGIYVYEARRRDDAVDCLRLRKEVDRLGRASVVVRTSSVVRKS